MSSLPPPYRYLTRASLSRRSFVTTNDLLASIKSPAIYERQGLPQSPSIADGKDTKRLMSKDAPSARWNAEMRARLTLAFMSWAEELRRKRVASLCDVVIHVHELMPTPQSSRRAR